MRFYMISFLLKILTRSLLCFPAIVFAANTSSHSSEFYDIPCHASFRHIEAGGIGYNQGYSSFEGFFVPNQDQFLMPFLDVRAHIFNDGKIAANVGLGLRTTTQRRVYGINTYYDYRKTQKIHYNQMGFGLEALGNRWDFRLNGYLPMGKKITSPYQKKFVGFSGNQMIISQKYQFAMKGAQAELGIHFGESQFGDFYAAAGSYYFVGKVGPHIWGGKGRLGIRFKEYFTFELSDSYDKMFHNRFQCQLTFTVPFGKGSCTKQTDAYHSCKISDVLYSRLIQPVERQEIIVVGCQKKCVAARDPLTRKPFHFVFVDNTSHSQGTYESPYPTLALAQANSGIGDIIYVFPGDGTTQGMDAGITLQLNQKFWGSGINHALQTSQGNFIIPAQSTSTPKMTNMAGDGITLAAVNQVSGFMLTDVAGNGIFGANAENIEISECTIDSSQSDQIHLESNGFTSTTALNDLVITNGVLNGIFIDSNSSSMACTVNNCTIQGTTVYSIDASFANQATVNITNNTLERNENGISINFNGISTLLISENIFNNSTSISSTPLLITAGVNPLSAVISNNIISGNESGAIYWALNDTNSAQLTISNNTITNNGSGALGSLGSALVINPQGSTLGNCQLNITNNIFSNNGAAALYCSNGSLNNFRVNATGNTITDNGGGGLVFANPCTTFMLNATDNIISNGRDHGITTAGITIADAYMNITNNQITGNTNYANAIALSHAGTDLNLIVTNNNLSNNDTSGIILYSSDVIDNVTIDIENNIINNNQNLGSNSAGGIDLEQYNNLSGSLINNTLSNNGSPDVFIGSGESSPSVCLYMSANNSTTGYTLSSGTGIFNLAPCNVNTVNTGTITPIGTITAVQSCPDATPCPP